MNIAAVINVAPGQAALSHATQTQNLLLEHLGPRLGSIRLAVPRLLKLACLGAIAEKPDVLVVAGGPRAARRAGQIAYAHRLPILFLPGHRSPRWTRRLWGSLSLEGMVTALAQGAVTPLHLPAGMAGGHIFFGNAICGFLPQIRQLRDDLADVETVAAAARLLAGAAAACSLVFGPRIAIRCHGASRKASAIVIGTQGSEPAARDAGVPRLGSFTCTAWRQGTLSLARASLRAAAGGDWQSEQNPECFSCTTLHLHAGRKTWLLLDGEAIALRGPVELRYLPRTVKTFAFASDRATSGSRLCNSFLNAQDQPWNPGPLSHVRISGRDWTGA